MIDKSYLILRCLIGTHPLVMFIIDIQILPYSSVPNRNMKSVKAGGEQQILPYSSVPNRNRI